MATVNSVKENESVTRVKNIGDMVYLCYADFGVQSESTPGWAVKRIDKSNPDNMPLDQWANGTKEKIHAIDDTTLESLTFLNLI